MICVTGLFVVVLAVPIVFANVEYISPYAVDPVDVDSSVIIADAGKLKILTEYHNVYDYFNISKLLFTTAEYCLRLQGGLKRFSFSGEPAHVRDMWVTSAANICTLSSKVRGLVGPVTGNIRRNKRGIVDFVGSVDNVLFGVMDNNDRLRINEELSLISSQQISSATKMNGMITGIKDSLSVLESSITAIGLKTEKKINKLERELQEMEKALDIINMLNQYDAIYLILARMFEEIENQIKFASRNSFILEEIRTKVSEDSFKILSDLGNHIEYSIFITTNQLLVHRVKVWVPPTQTFSLKRLIPVAFRNDDGEMQIVDIRHSYVGLGIVQAGQVPREVVHIEKPESCVFTGKHVYCFKAGSIRQFILTPEQFGCEERLLSRNPTNRACQLIKSDSNLQWLTSNTVIYSCPEVSCTVDVYRGGKNLVNFKIPPVVLPAISKITMRDMISVILSPNNEIVYPYNKELPETIYVDSILGLSDIFNNSIPKTMPKIIENGEPFKEDHYLKETLDHMHEAERIAQYNITSNVMTPADYMKLMANKAHIEMLNYQSEHPLMFYGLWLFGILCIAAIIYVFIRYSVCGLLCRCCCRSKKQQHPKEADIELQPIKLAPSSLEPIVHPIPNISHDHKADLEFIRNYRKNLTNELVRQYS